MKFIYTLTLLLFLASCEEERNLTNLFRGNSLEGWKATSDANWSLEAGVLSASEGKPGFLVYETGLENFELHVEFRAGEKTNSGVFVSFDQEPTDPATDCYEINIAPPDNPFPTGSIVARERVAPEVIPEEWHAFKIEVGEGTVRIELDGERVVEHKADPVSTGGWIGLQYREGPVSFRNVKIGAR